MPRNVYYQNYESPNIIIVPTVNFCDPPPQTVATVPSQQIADPIVNSPIKKYEEKSPVNDIIVEPSLSVSNCNQQDLLFENINTSLCASIPGFSENIQNSPYILQNTTSTEVSSRNMSYNTKDLSTPKYKSRNNLVDLTGFNLMKRDNVSSLSKRQDLRAKDNTKIKRDKTPTSPTDLRRKITEGSRKYRDHERRCITDYPNRSRNDISIRQRGGIDSHHSTPRYKKDLQRSVRHHDDHEIKYKRNNQLKNKLSLHNRIQIETCETSKMKADVKKESKQHATCQKSEERGARSPILTSSEKNYNNIKVKHQSNSNTVFIESSVRRDGSLPTNLSQKMDDDGIQDLRSRLSRKRSRSKCSEHHEPMEKSLDVENLVIPVTQDMEANSPILAPTVYEPKPKKLKPNELISEKCLNSNEDNSDENSLAPTVYEPKPKTLKPNELINEKCSNSSADNSDENSLAPTVYEPKPKTLKPNELINEKCPNSNADNSDENLLAPTVYEPKPETLKPNELINEKCSNSRADNSDENSLVPTVYEPKPETLKPNELINEKCSNSSTDNSDENLLAPTVYEPKQNELTNEVCPNLDDCDEDSLLDYFINHADEIVASMNSPEHKEAEDNERTTDKNSEEINPKTDLINMRNNEDMSFIEINSESNTSENGKSEEETKSKVDLNIDQENTETIQDKETSFQNQVNNKNEDDKPESLIFKIFLRIMNMNPNTEKEDTNLEIGTIAYTKNHKDVQDVEQNTKINKNSLQETNNTTDVNKKAYEEYAPKETISLCEDKQNIATKSNIENNIKQKAKNIPDLAGKADVGNLQKETKSICKDKKIIENSVNKKNTKQDANNTIDLTGKAYEEIAPKVTKSLSMDKQKIILNTNYEINPIQETNNIIDLTEKAYNKNASNEAIEINSSNDSIVEVIDITNQTFEINDCSNKASLQTMFNTDQNKTINNTNIKCDVLKLLNNLEQHVKDKKDNVKDTVESSLEIFNKLEHNGSISKYTEPEQIHGCTKKTNEDSIQKSGDAATLETTFNGTTKQHGTGIKMGTQMSNIPDKNNVKETESKESPNQILPKTTKNSIKQNVAIKIDADPLNVTNIQENRSQNSGMAIVPVCQSNETFKEHGQTFKDAVNKPANEIEKKTQNACQNPNAKPSLQFENELLLGSDNSTKETPETPKTSLVQNTDNTAENETLEKCETILTSKTIGNDEQKPSTITISSNKCDKKFETKPDKNKEETSKKTSAVKAEKGLAIKYKEFISSINKSDVKNQNKSQETMKTNTQKIKTNLSKKDSDSKIVTNTKIGQEKIAAKNNLVPTNKDNAKCTMQIQRLSPKIRSCVSIFDVIEKKMYEYFKKKYTVSSVIHCGRFSTIYKCFDTKGEPYALKLVNQQKGYLMKTIFGELQQQRPRQDSSILFVLNTFVYENRWCLLTEYFPKNLDQVLQEKTRGFHVDRVQVLSRQLVDAVNMLTNAGIIHSDIKPSHILLNDANDRLKLCGFDRANFSHCMEIKPSTGTLIYRAPEIILGFLEDHRIDVWSTALVIFEMATKKPLFDALYNNGLLYQHLLTFGSFDMSMIEQCRYGHLYFSGTSFKRKIGRKRHENVSFIDSLDRIEYLRDKLFEPYCVQNRAKGTTRWQITMEMDKIETLHTLLKQMLALDPRNRLPIQFVNASEFMNHNFTSA